MTLRALTLVVPLLALAAPPSARAAEPHPEASMPIGLSGNFWTDMGYMMRDNAREGQYDQDAAYMQGRLVLAADHHTVLPDFFVSARAELIAFVNEFTKSQFEPHVLDAYLMLGQDLWDLQIGRFLAWEVYHRGQGIELYTAEEAGALGGPPLYWLQTARGHKNEAGQLALHLYPTDVLSFELAGVYGQESNQNNFGVRPVVDLHVGGFQAIAGYEYLTQQPQTSADKVEVTSQGVAARLEYAWPCLRVGGDVGWQDVEYIDIQGLVDGERTLTRLSAGGFVDVHLAEHLVGLGYHFTVEDNEQGEENTHHQAFASYLVPLPVDGLSVKLVYGFALAHIQDNDAGSEWDNTMHSVRVRVAYVFR